MIYDFDIFEEVGERKETSPPQKPGWIVSVRVKMFVYPKDEYNKKDQVWYRVWQRFIPKTV